MDAHTCQTVPSRGKAPPLPRLTCAKQICNTDMQRWCQMSSRGQCTPWHHGGQAACTLAAMRQLTPLEPSKRPTPNSAPHSTWVVDTGRPAGTQRGKDFVRLTLRSPGLQPASVRMYMCYTTLPGGMSLSAMLCLSKRCRRPFSVY